MTVLEKKRSHPASRDVLAGFSKRGWLAGRSENARRLILSCGRVRRYEEGETIYHIGDPPEGLYGLIKGGVIVTIPNDAGTDFAVYQSTNGFWIGDLALFADQVRLVSVVASEDTEVLFLPSRRIQKLVGEHPELIQDFYALSHVNMAIALRLLANMAILDTKKRMAAWLLFSNDGLGENETWIPTSQERLAAMIAVSVPTAQRLLKSLAGLNLVEIGYRRLRVRDRAALVDYLRS